ncbi:hypothetical protein C0992_006624 [Termitomyces sp. T32_za158]|nr:hypothetical protein C0992_006624 [Termitomyces sp. T32_za158]
MSSGSARGTVFVTGPFTETGRTFVLHLAKKFDIAVNDLPRLGVPKVQLENQDQGGKSVSIDGNSWKSLQTRTMVAREIKSGIDNLNLRGPGDSHLRGVLRGCRGLTPEDMTKSILKNLGKTEDDVSGCLKKTYQYTEVQVSRLLPGTDTIGVFSGTESGGRPALTFVFVGAEGFEGGSVPGAMGPLKSAIRGLTEAAATKLGSYGVNVNSYFTRKRQILYHSSISVLTLPIRCHQDQHARLVHAFYIPKKQTQPSLIKESAESTTAPVDNLLGKNVDETADGPGEIVEDVADIVSFLTSKSARSISGTVHSLPSIL